MDKKVLLVVCENEELLDNLKQELEIEYYVLDTDNYQEIDNYCRAIIIDYLLIEQAIFLQCDKTINELENIYHKPIIIIDNNNEAIKEKLNNIN